MKTTRLIVGLLAVGLFATACGSDSKSSGGSAACKPVKPGVLSVVTSLPGPNFWGTTKRGRPGPRSRAASSTTWPTTSPPSAA